MVRYTAEEESNHLPLHTDESTHSIVIALNDEYEGGGTYISEQDMIARLRKGEILSFRGDSMLHGGEALRSGTRLIVAVFLYHDDDANNLAVCTSHPSRKRPPTVDNDNDHAPKETRTSFSFNFHMTH